MTEELKFLIRITKEANDLITDDFIIKAKGSQGDLVTNFDEEIETFMTQEIKKNYPEFDIISEEFNNTTALSKNCFVIDPIDGTINFANGLPLWGIQTACIKEGKTVAAVIFLPKLNELYYADENGAFLNGKKIHVNESPVKKCMYTIEGPNVGQGSVRMQKHSVHLRFFWTSCVDFAWVAAGRLGGTNVSVNNPWDYIPGLYLVQQAGGFIYIGKDAHIAANSKEFMEILKNETILLD